MYFLVDFKSKNILLKSGLSFLGTWVLRSAGFTNMYLCVSYSFAKSLIAVIAKKNNSDCAIKVFEFSCKNYFNPESIPFCKPFGVELWKYVRQDVWQFCVCMFLTVAMPFLWSFCIILNCTVSWTNWIVPFFLWWDSIPFFVLLFSRKHQIDLSFQYQKPFLKLNFEVHRKWFRFRKPQEKHPFLYRSRRVIKMQEFSTSTWRFTNHFSLVWI